MTELLPILLPAVFIALAAFTQGVSGFGFGMVSMATLPLVLGIKEAVPVVAAFSMMLNIVLAVKLWDAMDIRKLAPLLIGGVLTVPVGVLFLREADPQLLRGVLGVLVVGFAVWLGLEGAVKERSKLWGLVAGMAGGVLGGAFNMSGPPAVAYVSSKPWEPRQVRATLQAFFTPLVGVQVALFISSGLITLDTVKLNLSLLPALVVGALVGDRLASRIPADRFRVLVRVLLGVLGGVMVYKSVTG